MPKGECDVTSAVPFTFNWSPLTVQPHIHNGSYLIGFTDSGNGIVGRNSRDDITQ